MKTWIPDARNFSYLTWKQVDALPRDNTPLVLPTAAIEQHGHHLPLATDTLINNLLLGKALAKISADLPVYALPPVCYGKSNEHIGFPGTLSVSANTFMAVVRDLGASIAAAGFKKVVLYNTHGGNTSLVDVLARDLRAEFGLRTFSLFGSPGANFDGVSAQERTYGFHAGEIETAYLIHATPTLVHKKEYTTNYIARVDKPEPLKPEDSSAILRGSPKTLRQAVFLAIRLQQLRRTERSGPMMRPPASPSCCLRCITLNQGTEPDHGTG